MSDYVVQKDPDSSYGVYFPDLNGCYAAGDTASEAVSNGRTSLRIYADAMHPDGSTLPPARSIEQLMQDPELTDNIAGAFLIAIPLSSEDGA